MSRKLLNLQNEAIANDPAAEARATDNADRELETELPELHTVPTPEAALDLSPETVARAVDELRAQAAAAGEEDEPEPLRKWKNRKKLPPRQSPQPCSRRKKRRKTQHRRLKQKNSRRQKKHPNRKRPRISRTIPPGTPTTRPVRR